MRYFVFGEDKDPGQDSRVAIEEAIKKTLIYAETYGSVAAVIQASRRKEIDVEIVYPREEECVFPR